MDGVNNVTSMRVASSQHAIAGSSSNSFSPGEYNKFEFLGTAVRREQPLCGNIEGWGPLSPHRWDFTPCFLDVLVAVVAVGGIVAGAGAIWYLMRKEKETVRKDWHFWAKLVSHDCFTEVLG